MNNGSSTHFNVASGNDSTIDLSFCSASIFGKLKWKALEELYDSDHCPILINFDSASETIELPEKWKIKKANWPLYKNSILNKLKNQEENVIDIFLNIHEMTEKLIKIIIEAAETAAPKSNGFKSRKANNKEDLPWWNKDCAKVIKGRKKALNRYEKHPNEENNVLFKISRAKARRIIKESARNSWRNLLFKLILIHQ